VVLALLTSQLVNPLYTLLGPLRPFHRSSFSS
jgi:hypothetical protein